MNYGYSIRRAAKMCEAACREQLLLVEESKLRRKL